MKRVTIMMLTMAIAAFLAMPAGARTNQNNMVPDSYELLDARISHAWQAGLLTRAELDRVRGLQAEADRMIRAARRDHRMTTREVNRVRNAALDAVNTFNRYQNNGQVRYVASVKPTPKHKGPQKAKVRVVLR